MPNDVVLAPMPGIFEGFEDRQKLMDEIMTACKRMDVSPSTAVSAALYAAAVAAIRGLECDLQKFLEMAHVVYDDVSKQTANTLVS